MRSHGSVHYAYVSSSPSSCALAADTRARAREVEFACQVPTVKAKGVGGAGGNVAAAGEDEGGEGAVGGGGGTGAVSEGAYVRRVHVHFKSAHVLRCLEGALRAASPSLGAASIMDGLAPFCSGREGRDMASPSLRALSVCMTSLPPDREAAGGALVILLGPIGCLGEEGEGARQACEAAEAVGDVAEWLGRGFAACMLKVVYPLLAMASHR